MMFHVKLRGRIRYVLRDLHDGLYAMKSLGEGATLHRRDGTMLAETRPHPNPWDWEHYGYAGRPKGPEMVHVVGYRDTTLAGGTR